MVVNYKITFSKTATALKKLVQMKLSMYLAMKHRYETL